LWTQNLHLGNRSDADLRLAQLNEVLQDVARVDPACILIMAGDLNLDASKPRVSETLARAGLRDAVPTALVATTPHRHLLEPGHNIDWAFVRATRSRQSSKISKASDHYPISFELRRSACRPKKLHPPGLCQFSELAALFITVRVVYARLSSSITPHPFPLLIVRHFAEAWGLVPVPTVFCFSDFPDGEPVALFFCVGDQKGERH